MGDLTESVLRTPRLTLEPIRREDSDDLFEAVVGQESVMRWLATGHAADRSAAEDLCDDHVAHWARHGYGDYAVRDVTTRTFLGRVGLRNRSEHGVDLGFALHPRVQGGGIASEAGRACLRLAFTRLGLPAVFAFVLPDNAASITLVTRLGGKEVGTVVSSGRRCLRFRFGPECVTAAAYADNDDALRLIPAPGPGDPANRAALSPDVADPFGFEPLGLAWAEHEHDLTARCEGRPIARVGWLVRDMAFDGELRRVAGLGGVLVHPAHRGRGVARTVLSVAIEHARAADARSVLSLCRPERASAYRRLGWRPLAVPVRLQQPDGPRPWPLCAVTYDLVDLPAPTHDVDLRGLPF